MKHVLIALALALAAPAAQAATITNGSFEEPGFTGAWQRFGLGDSIGGWTVTKNGVDVIGTYWTASDGAYSLDLNGFRTGAVQTAVTDLIVGNTYRILFDMSANPDSWRTEMLLEAAVAGVSGTFSAVTSSASRTDMAWSTRTLDFTATAATATLSFTSLISGRLGPVIDNVRVLDTTPGGTPAAVPLPATGILLLAGLCGLALMRRRA